MDSTPALFCVYNGNVMTPKDLEIKLKFVDQGSISKLEHFPNDGRARARKTHPTKQKTKNRTAVRALVVDEKTKKIPLLWVKNQDYYKLPCGSNNNVDKQKLEREIFQKILKDELRKQDELKNYNFSDLSELNVCEEYINLAEGIGSQTKIEILKWLQKVSNNKKKYQISNFLIILGFKI